MILSIMILRREPGMEFRYATIDDAPLLAALNKQLIDDERHRNAMSVAQLAERMSAWLQGDYRAVIFSLAGEIVGYVLFRPEPEHVYIRQFYISPQHRRRGLGRAAIQWLRANAWADAGRLRLDVLAHNQRGIAFWRAVGFSDYCVTMEAETRNAD